MNKGTIYAFLFLGLIIILFPLFYMWYKQVMP